MRGVVVVVAVAAACSNNAAPSELGKCQAPMPAQIEQDPQHATGFEWDTDELRGQRRDCHWHKNDPPSATLGAFPSLEGKFDHVIVILRENRSYDHYFANLRAQHVPLPLGTTNPDPNPDDAGVRGSPVPLHHATAYCTEVGPDHEWNASRLQFDNGNLDGFVAASNTTDRNDGGRYAMSQYDGDDLKFYYWLADNYALSESYHAALLGPTMANLSFYFNATSCGTTENVETVITGIFQHNPFETSCPKDHSIFDKLGDKAKVYNDGPSLLDFPVPDSGAVGLTNYPLSRLGTIGDFRKDVDADENGTGHLADVIFIEPNYGHTHIGTQNDEHPPSNVSAGQHFVWDIVTTLMKHPKVFSRSVVFITWDENGGFYDHVVPPPACAPDNETPCDFKFDRYGFRVPLFAISPYAIPKFASHYTADHTSILRFIEAWKGYGALTNRDANAWPMFDMFDFAGPPHPIPQLPDEPAVGSCRPTGAL